MNLYDFADIQMGYSFNSQMFNEDGNGIPAIRIRDIPSQRTSTYTTEETDDKYIVEQGDILIGMDGFFYTDYWAGQRGYLVQRVCRIRAKNPDLQGYLLEALKPSIKYFEQTISGATVAHLGTQALVSD
ncbi:MAG: restriction endonuclease subunit S [Saprospirales bacterium]|nr:restriction endonuclease subunit S [Saprospirales bacterium]